jgi:hypothetical protein
MNGAKWCAKITHHSKEPHIRANHRGLAYTKFKGLLPRVSCRSEFGDVLHEMITEIGCSHLYEFVSFLVLGFLLFLGEP